MTKKSDWEMVKPSKAGCSSCGKMVHEGMYKKKAPVCFGCFNKKK